MTNGECTSDNGIHSGIDPPKEDAQLTTDWFVLKKYIL